MSPGGTGDVSTRYDQCVLSRRLPSTFTKPPSTSITAIRKRAGRIHALLAGTRSR